MDKRASAAGLLFAGLALYLVASRAMSAIDTTASQDGSSDAGNADWMTPGYIPPEYFPSDSTPQPENPLIVPMSDAAPQDFAVNEYPKYAAAITQAETNFGIPQPMLARLLYAESRYRADIISGATRSRVGAVGIAQFMPATAASLGVDPLDPVAAINGAGRYLRQLYGMFGDWNYAIAAYNWGPGNMRKYLAGSVSTIPDETRKYLVSITGGSFA